MGIQFCFLSFLVVLQRLSTKFLIAPFNWKISGCLLECMWKTKMLNCILLIKKKKVVVYWNVCEKLSIQEISVQDLDWEVLEDWNCGVEMVTQLMQ